MKNKSLVFKIWSYLVLFAALTLITLWLFQIFFFDVFYEYQKTNLINNATEEIILINREDDSYAKELDAIAIDKEICIEIIENNKIVYTSNSFGIGCVIGDYSLESNYKKDFENSDTLSQTYKIINPRYGNDTLIKAINIDDTYIYVNATLEPLDETKTIITDQLMIVTSFIILLSLIISYFISQIIASPILKINKYASKLSNKNKDKLILKSDIIEINQLANTLNETALELSKTEQLRQDLMANVSHDLKTPLTMIKAYAEMIKDISYKTKEKREQHLDIIIEETNRLSLLVNDILELTKIESNIDLINKTNFDLVKTVKSITNKFEILTEKEGYKFTIISDKKVFVYADETRISQVLYNLINNAINYTGKDKLVTIKIKKDDKIKVNIIDTGKGIKDEDINLIWDRYYKTEKNHKRNTYGTGLGLSIVKGILEKHNSEFGVISKKNKGTTFYFDLDKSNE